MPTPADDKKHTQQLERAPVPAPHYALRTVEEGDVADTSFLLEQPSKEQYADVTPPATPTPSTAWGARVVAAVLWLEPFWIAALAPSLLFRDFFWEEWLHPWLVGALLLFWPLRLLFERRLAPPVPLNPPIYVLLGWSLVGLWAVTDPARAWYAAGLLALGIAIYIALLNWPPMQRRPWLATVPIVGSGLLLSALGPELLARVPTEFFTFSETVARSKPIDLFGWGETINPNILAGSLLLPIPLLCALGIRRGWTKRRWLPPCVLLLALPMLITVLLAQSRGSYLALFVALMVVCILRWPLSAVAFAITFAALAVVLTIDGAVLFLEALGSDGSITSFSGRLEIWQHSLSALAYYAITGVGLGQFDVVLPAIYPGLLGSGRIPHAHNLFLQIALELGLPGLLCFLWLLVVTMRQLYTIIRDGGYGTATTAPSAPSHAQEAPASATAAQRRSSRRAQVHARRRATLRWALAVGTLAALIGLIVHGLIDAVTWGTKLAFLPWFFFALVALLVHQEPQTQPEQKQHQRKSQRKSRRKSQRKSRT